MYTFAIPRFWTSPTCRNIRSFDKIHNIHYRFYFIYMSVRGIICSYYYLWLLNVELSWQLWFCKSVSRRFLNSIMRLRCASCNETIQFCNTRVLFIWAYEFIFNIIVIYMAIAVIINRIFSINLTMQINKHNVPSKLVFKNWTNVLIDTICIVICIRFKSFTW